VDAQKLNVANLKSLVNHLKHKNSVNLHPIVVIVKGFDLGRTHFLLQLQLDFVHLELVINRYYILIKEFI
jgi:hypothetical protein